jgi:3',5'-cyclic AMP phosphodiesterase CpdA
MSAFAIAQISDLHITDAELPYGIDTGRTLERVLAAIGDCKVDAIIATGDLVQDGRVEEYARLREVLASAPAPVFLLPGNHDEPAALRSAFSDHRYWPASGDLSYAIEHLSVRIVMLDDTWPGEIGGRMTPKRAHWLDDVLSQAPDRATLLCLHHPPFDTGDPGFDEIGLKDTALLAEVLSRHGQVQRVVCGHFHRACIGDIVGRAAIVCPSSGWQYRLALHKGDPHTPPTHEPPGFLVHRAPVGGAIVSTALWI